MDQALIGFLKGVVVCCSCSERTEITRIAMESPNLVESEDKASVDATGDSSMSESVGTGEKPVEATAEDSGMAEDDEKLFGDEDEAMSETESAEQPVKPETEDTKIREEPRIDDKEHVKSEEEQQQEVKSERKQETGSDELVVPQAHEIVIPNYARWFNLLKIHSIEKESLPEFFTNRVASKTPQVYVKYRNFMVNAYRLNPNEYFGVTAARRNVCGDAAAIFRVHKFLMKWGLINYQVDAKVLPNNVEPPFTGEFSTRHDAPRGLFPFESYKPSVQLPDMAKLKKMMDTNNDSSALHKYLHERKRKMSNQSEEKAGETEPKQETDVNGIEDQESSPNPVKKAKVLEDTSVQWTREELQKLLKGLQEHGSDWYKVAKGIDNKTPEQCILKFLQLPIEDRFLHGDNQNSDLGPLKYAPHLPYSKSENPVMSTIAFLVGLVDPKVVQQMTSRALKTMDDLDNKETDSPADETKEGSEIALASLGVRSHVFATNEERQLNAIANEMVEVQLAKTEVKLKFLDRIEKALELDKKALQRQQEDTLVQRLALAKHSRTVYDKLEHSLELFDDKDKLASHLSEIKQLLASPPKMSIGSAFGLSNGGEASPSQEKTGAKSEHEVKPVSIEAPQFYRYWSA